MAANRDSIYRKFSNEPSRREEVTSPERVYSKPWDYKQLQSPARSFTPKPQDEPKQKVTVHVAGMQYRLLVGEDESESYIKRVAERADLLVTQIQKNSQGMPLTSVTVLALMNAIDQLAQTEARVSELEQERNEAVAMIDQNKAGFTHLREINWELKKELVRLQGVIDSYESAPYDEDHTNMNTEPESDMLPLEELAREVFGNTENEDNR